jgi:type II secretion system protein E
LCLAADLDPGGPAMILLNHGRRIGEMLVERGLLAEDDLDQALSEQRRTGERLGEILVKMGAVPQDDLMRALSEQLHIPYMSLNEVKIDRELIQSIAPRLVKHYNFVPLARENGVLRVAMTDPLDVHTLDELRLHLKIEVDPVFSTSKDIHDTIKRFYGIGADTMDEMMDDEPGEKGAVDFKPPEVDDIEDLAEDASIVRFVNQIILEAIDERATDIHFEPLEEALRIRYRIDGLLYEASVPTSVSRFQAAIISRLKIMADMNIAERRLPQDGKIKIRKGDSDYDLRVSTIPTPNGESVVMRILSRDSEFVTLEKLGFDKHHSDIMREMINRPHGILLVTGPTGSGKSTTLYAALNEINTVDKKILTVEEPIEYRIRGVMQVQVNPAIHLTFARCLRTFLRQDPDVIMVGETRDLETAQIAIQASLTGHLVFSTLHTNDAVSAVTRLLDMGIEPFLISSSIEGLLAQRLVRKLCPHCKQVQKPDPRQIKKVNVTGDDPASLTLYRNRGCEKCRYTGFLGRSAIFEIARVSEDFRRQVVERVPANILRQLALKQGMRPMRMIGWQKCKEGVTTIEEVLRVTMEEEIAEDEMLEAAADGVPSAVAAEAMRIERDNPPSDTNLSLM